MVAPGRAEIPDRFPIRRELDQPLGHIVGNFVVKKPACRRVPPALHTPKQLQLAPHHRFDDRRPARAIFRSSFKGAMKAAVGVPAEADRPHHLRTLLLDEAEVVGPERLQFLGGVEPQRRNGFLAILPKATQFRREAPKGAMCVVVRARPRSRGTRIFRRVSS